MTIDVASAACAMPRYGEPTATNENFLVSEFQFSVAEEALPADATRLRAACPMLAGCVRSVARACFRPIRKRQFKAERYPHPLRLIYGNRICMR